MKRGLPIDSPYFQRFFSTQEEKPSFSLPQKGNKLIHSKVASFEHFYDRPTLSLKYVMSGEEQYHLEGQCFQVKAGAFLLINAGREYHVHSPQKKAVDEGLCVYLDKQLIREVYQVMQNSAEKCLNDPYLAESQGPDFLEKIYLDQEDALGRLLRELGSLIRQQSRPALFITSDIFYTIAEKLLLSQKKVRQLCNRLDSAKASTREELFKRLEVARTYMLEYYSRKLEMAEVARAAAISEYHFFRTFKQVYRVSPYQYLMQKRLQVARDLLQAQQHSITEVAYLTGFSDIHTFSKAFKRTFQVSPKQMLQIHP